MHEFIASYVKDRRISPTRISRILETAGTASWDVTEVRGAVVHFMVGKVHWIGWREARRPVGPP